MRRLLAAGGDVVVEVGAVDADVLADFDDGDASFGAESADEADAGAESFGGLVDGEQHRSSWDCGRPGLAAVVR